MNGFQLKIQGNWGHFKRPETNNNPLSHDFITKTALIGMIGSVLGIERSEMKHLFPKLSEDMLYGVQLLNPVKKLSWGFTSRKAINPTSTNPNHRSPKYFEFLRKPSFIVSIANMNERSDKTLDNFKESVRNEESVYEPVLGWHNCPAELSFISQGTFRKINEGEFETVGFIETSPTHEPVLKDFDFRVGFEKMPTYQNDDFWNLPEKYREIIYPDASNRLKAKGAHYEYSEDKNNKWWLI